MFQLPPRPEYFSAAHEAFRATVRRFVDAEIAPHASAWDEAGTFPRELYRRAAAVGITGIGYPEALGGTPADIFFHIAAAEEIARAGCGGVQASLGSHGIALPPIVAHGSAELQAPRGAAGAGGRQDRRVVHHRAGRRLRRGGAEDHRGARRRPLRRDRREDLHHLGRARRLPDRRGAHRPGQQGPGRRVAAGDRRRHAGPDAQRTQEDGLVEQRHRAPALRRAAACRWPTAWAPRARASRPSCTTSTASG